MAIIGKQPNIIGSYLEVTQRSSPLDVLLREVRRLGPAASLADLSDALGVNDEEFARLVGECESRGYVKRDRSAGRATLSLTAAGLDREVATRESGSKTSAR